MPEAFGIEGVSITETSLQLPADLTFERWCELIATLRRAEKSLGWLIGDAVQQGIARFGDIVYQSLGDMTDRHLDSIIEYGRISDRFPPDRRHPELPWSHHQAVAALPAATADLLLAEAAENGSSVRDIRARVRRERKGVSDLPKVITVEGELGPWVVAAEGLLGLTFYGPFDDRASADFFAGGFDNIDCYEYLLHDPASRKRLFEQTSA